MLVHGSPVTRRDLRLRRVLAELAQFSTASWTPLSLRRLSSTTATIVAILSVLIHGLALGIDFTGGALVEANYTSEANLTDIRTDLEAAGLEVAQVQTFGSTSDVLIRLRPSGDIVDPTALQAQILEILRARRADVTLQPATTIGALKAAAGQPGATWAAGADTGASAARTLVARFHGPREAAIIYLPLIGRP